MQRNPHSYQIATGYRTFYSLSLIYQPITKKRLFFNEKKGLLKEGEISASNSSRSLYQKVNDASQYLYKEKIADETILKAVKLLTKERNSIWGVDTMNAYVHSNKLSPVPIDIQTTWDNIQDFMVTLWSQIESE